MEIATGGINLIPKTFTFDNYKTVWGMSGTGIASKVTYTDYTINSIKVSLMTVVLVVLFTSMSAYCFQRGNFPGQKFLYWLFMATMFIGAGTVTMFPLLRITTKLGLNNLPGLALVQFGTAGASNLFLTMGYLKTISKELDDAAKIDGCSFFSTWWRVILPLSGSSFAALAIITFTNTWNDYMGPMIYLTRDENKTIQVGLRRFILEYTSDYHLIMAASLVSLLPVSVVFLCLQKYFIEGIATSGLKG